MSGHDETRPDEAPVVFVASSPDAFAVNAVAALATLPERLPGWALVGGVAVAVNLNGFHRPTADLDTVSIDGERAIEVLIGDGFPADRSLACSTGRPVAYARGP